MPKKLLTAVAASLGACATLLSFPAGADDIDIFTGASAGTSINPRILIVLDNTSNWSRQAQKWPGGLTQGQSEVRAIKSAIGGLDDKVNVGLLEYVTAGNANDNGGYVRFNIQPMSAAARTAFNAKLDTIDGNITDPNEKRNSNTMYGNLLYDVYNYLGGLNGYSPSATPATLADPTAYTSRWGTFKSPLTADSSCAKTIVIFVTNPDQSGPTKDDSINTGLLSGLGGDTKQLGLPNFSTKTETSTTNIGQTSVCYSDAGAAAAELNKAPWPSTCANYTDGCKIGSALNDGSLFCPAGQFSWAINGLNTTVTNAATTGETVDSAPFNADEWARFMHDKGVPIPSSTLKSKVVFYTIDVYNAQQNITHTKLMLSMAKAGGGKYFAAKNQQAIVDALNQIIGEVLAVNSTFASTSLPVNSTNRSQNQNQVFIGMFRPDPDAKPRWFGNLKRYQLIVKGADVKLGDFLGEEAVNNNTGFVTDCAVSWWTTDNGAYWQNLGINPDPASACKGKPVYSDTPDGPLVEKGAVGQALRNGNDPTVTATAPTYAVNRKVLTRTASGSTLVDFDTSSSGLSADLVNYIKGADVNNERGLGQTTKTRPSIHGDVIHSRPLPLAYNDTDVFVFYGANDGTFRAIDASNGRERWAFIAPEFFSRLQRLKDQSPLVNYPNVAGPGDVAAVGTQKDYFFDGSTGVYQNADNSKIWLFPTMRRGGRMLYGLNVTNIDSPKLMWSVGCPSLSNDSGCTSGFDGIGQTWSTPSVAFIKGNSATAPLIAVGGGYDNCEDANTGAPTCTSGKGGFIYILNAETGVKIASFQTKRSVVGDISMVDIDGDGMPDYAYAADLGGNVYRIDFIDGPTSKGALSPSSWRMYRVAYTNDTTSPRKFIFAPSLLYSNGSVYLALGSGDREHPLSWQYPYTSVKNRFYVVLDSLANKPLTDAGGLDMDNGLTNNTATTDCNSPAALPNGSSKGWFMELAKGEQVVTSALIVSGTVMFSTNRPIVGSSASCSTALGEARGYVVNLFNASGAVGADGICGGNRSASFAGGGLPPSPVLASGVPVRLADGTTRRVSVVIGSGYTPSPIDSSKVAPKIKSTRKRKYTYVKGQ
ncbi:pilus assembly protein [Pseudoduganella violaceinigra]|uniref:pilus assembly protein n=1 Tax=Pseudoduganella violaceinigra TaxID=246602 RepID=UPI000408F61C|nr:PilC/PilY family type IV pilus protein [Pseudoduganella violaceinigra]